MENIINKSLVFLENLKDLIYIGYFIAMFGLAVVFLMEAKIYFGLDVLPGVDVPIDEWYSRYIH